MHLTPIEYKLLCLLSRNVGKVLTHTYITQQIWGRCSDNDVASLRVFYGNICGKNWSLRKMECNTSRHILALDIACLELRSKKLVHRFVNNYTIRILRDWYSYFENDVLDTEYVTEDIAQPSDLMIQQYLIFIAILVNNAFKRIAIDLFLII